MFQSDRHFLLFHVRGTQNFIKIFCSPQHNGRWFARQSISCNPSAFSDHSSTYSPIPFPNFLVLLLFPICQTSIPVMESSEAPESSLRETLVRIDWELNKRHHSPDDAEANPPKRAKTGHTTKQSIVPEGPPVSPTLTPASTDNCVYGTYTIQVCYGNCETVLI